MSNISHKNSEPGRVKEDEKQIADRPLRIDGIILAAGLSRRMGANKLLLPYRGRPLLQHAIDLVASLPLDARILVTRQDNLPMLRVPDSFLVVFNERGELGQSESLRLGLQQAHGEAFIFFQGDQPLLDRETALAVLARSTQRHIVFPEHRGRPGAPVCFPARFRKELMAVTGDCGGREVRDAHPDDCLRVSVTSAAVLLDVDDPESYRSLPR